MTEKQANGIAGVVCGRLCKYPGLTSGEEQLAEICEACPFIEALEYELNQQLGERSNYARIAGTPERLAACLRKACGSSRIGRRQLLREPAKRSRRKRRRTRSGASFRRSREGCKVEFSTTNCWAWQDDEDFDCTDERLTACILCWLMEEAGERLC